MLTIEVTAQDITYGKRLSPAYCPIALATARATGLDRVIATPAGVTTYRGLERQHHYRTSIDARQFILDFDGLKPVRPGTFELYEPGVDTL